ncbi:MAG: riboflavin biosynthesis protein RibF [Chitinophagaceae bacterium]|jgi:riboflavin kinase/FMN adenylyltransferase|nr:riboflavin biosynthesis protein RibF [Chitinophagaceae bacterium]
MQVHRDLQQLPSFTNAIITIGTFDGVHLGHQQIIRQLKEEAAQHSGETVIVTFHPHPRKIVSSVPGDIKLLTTLEERTALLADAGIDHLVVVPFDNKFSNQSAEEFITEFLYKAFRPHTLIIGYDHRFGKGRKGDYHLLEAQGAFLGFRVKEINEELLNESIVSSTRIRSALLQHDMATANSFLGYHYFFQGTVVEGNKLGRTIGYPTANLHIESEEKLIPADGIYACEVSIVSRAPAVLKKGMMYIGNRPVVEGKHRTIEVNIFDFDEDIYGETLRVYMHDYVRGDVPLNGLEELKEQLAKDKSAVERLLN